jgi:RNA polymerase sigma-70 factor, ECF subfamily
MRYCFNVQIYSKILELHGYVMAIGDVTTLWSTLLLVPNTEPFTLNSNQCDGETGNQSTETDLIRRFQQGDREAFTALYRIHQPTVARFTFYMTGDRDKAEELTQEVFVWLIHHPLSFNSSLGTLSAFLGGVARKLLQRQWRKQRLWQSLEELLWRRPSAREWTAPGVDPAQAVDSASLRKAITRLPPRYREAIVLCELEGKSYEEAAMFLKCPVGTVRSRLHRARILLVDKFQAKKSTSRSS